jgi:two-component system LytT family response regulator
MNRPPSIAKSIPEGAPIGAVVAGPQSRPLLVLIVDDEPIARARIELLLKRDPQIHLIGACASVAECERLDPGTVPDLVFLDIRMPQRDGFDLLESLSARGMRPFVIFVTAHSEHAVDAYDAGAIDYLLKPFDDVRFDKALARAKAALERDRIRGDLRTSDALGLDTRLEPDRLVVTEGNRIMLIATGNIELIQVTGKHVKIFVRQHCYLTRQTLRSVEARLDKRRFVRVHRSTIVNVEQIVALHPLLHGDSEVVLKRGTRVTMSRRFRRRLQPFLEKSCGLGAPGNGCSSE